MPSMATTTQPADASARELADRFWDRMLELEPLLGTSVGDERYDDRLPDPGEEGLAARAAGGNAAGRVARARARRFRPGGDSIRQGPAVRQGASGARALPGGAQGAPLLGHRHDRFERASERRPHVRGPDPVVDDPSTRR